MSPIMIYRGGLLGVITQTFNQRALDYLEENRAQLTQSSDHLHEEKVKKIMFSIDDDAHVLRKLAMTEYFSRDEFKQKLKGKRRTY